MRNYTSIGGHAGPTERVEVGDVAAAPLTQLTHPNTGKRIMAMLITVETEPIRIATGGTTPTSDPDGVGHELVASQSIRLLGNVVCSTALVINQVAGSDAVIQVTPEYEV